MPNKKEDSRVLSSTLNLDLVHNSASLNLSQDIYLRILQKAVLQTTQDIQKCVQALPVDDFEGVKAMAHKMKGDYDNLRITDMSSLAKRMEEIAKGDHDKEEIAELLNTFSAYFSQLKDIVIRQTS